MKILIIVNCSPWRTTLGVTALRMAYAMVAEGICISAVFFREEGVYQTTPSAATDAGTPALWKAWPEFAKFADTELLVCRSSTIRCLDGSPDDAFGEAGLARLRELMADSDKVVTW